VNDSYEKNSLKILSLAEEDRPREKLLLKGKAALSDAELLAILLGSGTASMNAVELARHILASADNNLNVLAKYTVKDLEKFKGIGEAKALTVMAALELGRRRKEAELPQKQTVTSSAHAFDLLHPHLMDLPHEEFWVLLLSRANSVLKKVQISSGGVAGTVADPKIIFKTAIENLASSLILVHNHPSGNLKPSQADLELTKKMKEAGKLLEIPVLDHLIIAERKYFSFADEGLL
jgi:DNA repair protein RadC